MLKENGNNIKKIFYFEKNIFYVKEYDGVHKFLTYDKNNDVVFGSTRYYGGGEFHYQLNGDFSDNSSYKLLKYCLPSTITYEIYLKNDN